jgi:predicted tellurium resistance membrane protein TerC
MINTLEMGILVLMVSFCFFFKKNQLGLLGTYIFVFYLGMKSMMAYQSTIIASSTTPPWAVYLYIFLGLLVVGSVMIEFRKQDQNSSKETIPTQ